LTDFHEMWYLRIFLKSVEKIKVSLKPGKNVMYFTWRPMYVYENIWLISSQNEKYFRQSCWENQNTFNVLSIFPLNRAVYEIIWKNTAEPGRPQMKIWCMRIACWMPEATDANSEYAILIVFHCRNGGSNASYYYVIRTLPVFFNYADTLRTEWTKNSWIGTL
jgi:hypothetical protein